MAISPELEELTVDIDSLTPRENNPRQGNLDTIKESLEVNGQYRPIVVNKRDGEILAGNHTWQAAKALGWEQIAVTYVDVDEEQAARIVLIDNRANDLAEYDRELLASLLADLPDLSGTGFQEPDLNTLLDEVQANDQYEGLNDPDEVPEAPEEAETRTQLGDIWQLGPHRVMCGDSTNANHVEQLMDGEKAQLIHADPPYGMGKENEGVLNDNLYKEKLDKFQMAWWEQARTVTVDNGSAYIWGTAEDLWRLWYAGGLSDSERLTFRNEIVWDQVTGVSWGKDGMSGLRSYATMGERCLFFMFGEQGFNTNADNYWEGWEPLRKYLSDEMEKCGGRKKWREALGNQMGSHYFTESQWAFPTQEAYNKLQAFAQGKAFTRDYEAFTRDYEELKRDYEELKQKFYDSRPYFDSGHEQMSDLWEYERVYGDERQGHATPKPVAMMERVMNSSLPAKGLCLEPFGGSGSTLMGAERTGRICYTMELDPAYCDVIVERWERHTGEKAQKV